MIILPSFSAGVSASSITKGSLDPDSIAYISAVETADGQSLETNTKLAIDNFIKGCKNDGIWDAIKTCRLFCAARTLNGALVGLKGTAPLSAINFQNSDYFRYSGLQGNGVNKSLEDSNLQSASPNNNHLAVNINSISPSATRPIENIIGNTFMNNTIGITFNLNPITELRVYNLSNTYKSIIFGQGFVGTARNSNDNFIIRNLGSSTIENAQASLFWSNSNLTIFKRNAPDINALFSAARINFYSAGEYLDLAKLNSRVNNLISDLS